MRTFVVVLLLMTSIPLVALGEIQKTSDRSFNVRFAPLSLLLGVLTADFDIGISESTTLGPSISLFNRNYNGVTYSGAGIGGRANFYLGHPRFTDSWVIGPFLYLVGIKVSQTGYNTVNLGGTILGTVVAYDWFWSNGFNIELGGSLALYGLNNNTNLSDGSGNTITVSTPYSGAVPGIDFTLGWAF